MRGLEHRGLRDRSVPFDDERQHDPPLDALFAGLFGIAEPGLDPLPEFDQVAALEQRHAFGDQKRCVVLLPGRSPGLLRGAFPRLGRDLHDAVFPALAVLLHGLLLLEQFDLRDVVVVQRRGFRSLRPVDHVERRLADAVFVAAVDRAVGRVCPFGVEDDDPFGLAGTYD